MSARKKRTSSGQRSIPRESAFCFARGVYELFQKQNKKNRRDAVFIFLKMY